MILMDNNNTASAAAATPTLELVSHGIFDERGRECGHLVATAVHMAGGWTVLVQPTRDGAKFGAIQRAKRCMTLDAVSALVAKKVAGGKARLAKKFGAVAVAVATEVTAADILDAPAARFIQTTAAGVELHLAYGWADADGSTVLTHTTLAGLATMLEGCTAA